MKRILITGMSGTGKSSVIAELAARGYKAVDADSPEYSEWVEVSGDTSALGSPEWGTKDWVWREDRVQELLSTEDADLLFVSGCAANMGKFLPQFDHVVLLSAPAEVIVERLATRTTNSLWEASRGGRAHVGVDGDRRAKAAPRRGSRDRRQRADSTRSWRRCCGCAALNAQPWWA